jgi:calcineurin-like phosphoesterase family protein
VKTFFTADAHFGHFNILKYCSDRYRQWQTTEEMDEALVKNWNQTVSYGDTVFFLGDLSFKNQKATERIMSRLDGDFVFLKGNHDSFKDLKRHRFFVFDSLVWQHGKQHIGMAHRPQDVPLGGKVTFGLCGHVHDRWKMATKKLTIFGSHEVEREEIILPVPIVNVGMDVWNYRPVSVDEIMGLLQRENLL